MSLGVTLAGIATAIYLERPHDPPLRPPPPVTASQDAGGSALPSMPAQTAVKAEDVAPRTAPPPDAPAAAATPEPPARDEPGIGTTAPQAPVAAALAQTATLEPPAEAPAMVPAAPAAAATEPARRYWVEYGVFVGPRYAKRLQEALAARGLDAAVVPSHGPGGRRLLRVRSAPVADYAQARAAAQSAGRALRLVALIHRSRLGSAKLAGAPPMPAARKTEYWVQFGAFPHRQQAARLSSALAQGGIDTVVTGFRAPSGRPIFVVRSRPLPDRHRAAALAMRGQESGNADFLIGQRSQSAPEHPRKPRSPTAPQAG